MFPLLWKPRQSNKVSLLVNVSSAHSKRAGGTKIHHGLRGSDSLQESMLDGPKIPDFDHHGGYRFCRVKIPSLDLDALVRGELVPRERTFGAFLPDWWPAIAWPHYVLIGTIGTVSVAVFFRTPKRSIAGKSALP
jgi:hypothetical protein